LLYIFILDFLLQMFPACCSANIELFSFFRFGDNQQNEAPRRKQRGVKMDYLFYFAPRGGEYNPRDPSTTARDQFG
jgi:hypothetical protein